MCPSQPKYFTAKPAKIAKSRQLSSSRKSLRTELFRIAHPGISPPPSRIQRVPLRALRALRFNRVFRDYSTPSMTSLTMGLRRGDGEVAIGRGPWRAVRRWRVSREHRMEGFALTATRQPGSLPPAPALYFLSWYNCMAGSRCESTALSISFSSRIPTTMARATARSRSEGPL